VELGPIWQLRRVLAGSGWWDAAVRLTSIVRASASPAGRLLVVGTAEHDPWHLVAHLQEATHRCGPGLPQAVLVRPSPPAGAPAHLAVGFGAIDQVRSGDAILVVSPGPAPGELLERLDHAHRCAPVVTVDGGDAALAALADARMDLGESTPSGSSGLRGLRGRGLQGPALPAVGMAEHVLAAAAVARPGLHWTGRGRR
jgi:hypothetical protein